MKSDHRHELKTNELAEWISNFPQWAKENRTLIITVLVVILAIGAAYIWRIHSKNVAVRTQIELTGLISQLLGSKMQILSAQAQGKDLSYMLVQHDGPADRLKNFAQNVNDDLMSAVALIKQAEALRTELHCRPGTVSKQDLAEQINRAKASYTEALETHLERVPNPSLTAAAQFGLGLCEEELGSFEKAQQIYRDITTNSDFEGTVAKTAAEQRLKTMADYKTTIVFKASAPVLSAKAETGAVEKLPIEIKTVDTNLPIDINLAPNVTSNIADINLTTPAPNDIKVSESNVPGK
jgi:hypothetical protein